ncbi:MAG: DUF2865 domain-containing protein [Pseudolabrys sp.]|nr:DUF2865 domain-containing protein [Pseudolabrys sp.]MBV9954118.1 DUF2865 domain-containing protein [Pseudolabrys sp.]
MKTRVAIVLALVTVTAIPATASAQGFFESLFGGFRRAAREVPRAIEAPVRSYGPEGGGFFPFMNEGPARGESGPHAAYCVRTCDGHFFPVQAQPGLSVAEACRAFCPKAETRIFTGSGIDRSVDQRGVPYADLPTAFAYRKQLVANCTCNGKTGGIAALDAAQDPTLRPGDIIATKTGLLAYSGGRERTAQFTPVRDFRGLSQNSRERLSEIKIMSRGSETTGAAAKD